MLPYFAIIEQEEMATRAERVDCPTTAKRIRKMMDIMRDKYLKETEDILRMVIFEGILKSISLLSVAKHFDLLDNT